MHKYRNGWLKGDCPACGKHDKFGVHIGRDKSNCFVCGYGPKLMQLISEYEQVEYNEAYKLISKQEQLEYKEPKAKLVEPKSDSILPESYKLVTLGGSETSKLMRRYVQKRGFKPNKVSLKGWGYCTKGKYKGHLIIPYYLNGRVVYFNARRVVGNGPKFNNPTMDDIGVGKSMAIYNISALKLYKKIYLVESAMNAETLGDHAIGTGGKKLSPWQKDKILNSSAEKIVIILDPDALKEAIDLALELSFHKKIKVLMLPEDNDVNDIGKKATKALEDQAKWLSYMELLKLKNDLLYEERSKHTR